MFEVWVVRCSKNSDLGRAQISLRTTVMWNVERELCLLCIFMPPPTSLITVVNLGSFRWALSVFLYFCFTSGLCINFAGDLNQKYHLK